MSQINLDIYAGLLNATIGLAVGLMLTYFLQLNAKNDSIDALRKFGSFRMNLLVGFPTVYGSMGLFHLDKTHLLWSR